MFGPGRPLTPTDERILLVARELCSQLGITKIIPGGISWADRVGLMKVSFGQALFTIFGEMILPRCLVGKLDVEEWRPLIASSIIFRGRLQWKSSAGMAVRMSLPIIPVALALVVLLPFLGEQQPLFLRSSLVVGLISFYLALAALAWSASWRHMKRMNLTADAQAAEHVGRERFLEVLKKLDSLELEEKGFRARLQPRPTIRERIQNIESLRLLTGNGKER